MEISAQSNNELSHHNSTNCPSCGHEIDAATDISDEGNTPSNGDISICLYCGGINQYFIRDESLTIQEMTQSSLDELKNEDPKTWNMIFVYQEKLRQFIAERN